MSHIVTLNGGSSSIKFALFDDNLARQLTGQFSRIGLEGAQLKITRGGSSREQAVNAPNHAACIPILLDLLSESTSRDDIAAVGHRIVHGGARFTAPARVTPELLDELAQLAPYAPEHLPAELELLKAFQQHDPALTHVACFDTAFHQALPRVAKLLPLPRRYFSLGVQRYGFHGLSYEYLMDELKRIGAASGKIILAHLGNGASMAAVRDGQPIDTTMSFTPTAGLVMSTRTGDLDPSIVAYLARTENMDADRFQKMVNAESGMLGISETSGDMRDLLVRESSDERSADAIAAFCHAAKKYIGAYAAELGGLDTLVFSGGIGENAAVIRDRICDGLEFLGIKLDPHHNAANAPVISTDGSRATVRVIRTDEEIQLAKHTRTLALAN